MKTKHYSELSIHEKINIKSIIRNTKSLNKYKSALLIEHRCK